MSLTGIVPFESDSPLFTLNQVCFGYVVKLMNECLTEVRRKLFHELEHLMDRTVLKGTRWLPGTPDLEMPAVNALKASTR